MTTKIKEFSQSFFHGTKAELRVGDLIVAGRGSNYENGRRLKHVYLTSNLNVAIWGAELAAGDGAGKIYVVEPTGTLEDDPNVTDKKFPGNPTKSYRTLEALQVVAIVSNWKGHSVEEIEARKRSLKELMENGAEIID